MTLESKRDFTQSKTPDSIKKTIKLLCGLNSNIVVLKLLLKSLLKSPLHLFYYF